MKTRPLYDHFTDELRIVPLRADFLLDQEEGIYDDNWIVSADDLFGKMELPMIDPNAYQDLVA